MYCQLLEFAHPNTYLFVRCLSAQFAQSHWNVFVLARTDAAESHSALTVVLPKRTWLVKVYFVKSEVVLDQQAAKTWVDFVIVKVIDGVHRTAAVMNRAFELEK